MKSPLQSEGSHWRHIGSVWLEALHWKYLIGSTSLEVPHWKYSLEASQRKNARECQRIRESANDRNTSERNAIPSGSVSIKRLFGRTVLPDTSACQSGRALFNHLISANRPVNVWAVVEWLMIYWWLQITRRWNNRWHTGDDLLLICFWFAADLLLIWAR